MKYKTFLKNKNLSKKTLQIYDFNIKLFLKLLNEKSINKTNILKVIKLFEKTHKPNSTRLFFAVILSYLSFLKKYKLICELRNIRLPSLVHSNKIIINLNEFQKAKNNYFPKTKIEKRNWLIFSFLFCTGIRVSEINNFNKKYIIGNTLLITGKGNKQRTIYLPNYLLSLINDWHKQKINVNSKNKEISSKQINNIIKHLGLTLFNKKITSHSLRRSFATNLLRKNIDLKSVSKILGHSNINTTSRYIFLTDCEIFEKIKTIF